jgi:hypothetical protein
MHFTVRDRHAGGTRSVRLTCELRMTVIHVPTCCVAHVPRVVLIDMGDRLKQARWRLLTVRTKNPFLKHDLLMSVEISMRLSTSPLHKS